MATETTATSAEAWAMNVRGFAPDDAVPDALILQTSTVSGEVDGDAPAVLVPYVGDATAAFVAEGAAIDEANPDLGQVAIFTGKVAQLVRVSAEQMNQPDASRLIMNSMSRAVTRKANEAYLAQAAPTSPAVTPPAGLLNSGITTSGTVGDSLDGLVDAFASIEDAGGNVTHIIASPTAWARLNKYKTAETSNAALLGAGAGAAERALLGVPVLVSSAMTANKLLVVDKSAVVSAVGPVRLARSDQAYFASDSIGVRVTWRFGAKVVDTDRVIGLTVNAPTEPA